MIAGEKMVTKDVPHKYYRGIASPPINEFRWIVL